MGSKSSCVCIMSEDESMTSLGCWKSHYVMTETDYDSNGNSITTMPVPFEYPSVPILIHSSHQHLFHCPFRLIGILTINLLHYGSSHLNDANTLCQWAQVETDVTLGTGMGSAVLIGCNG